MGFIQRNFSKGTFNAEIKHCAGSKPDTPLLSLWSAGRLWDVPRKAMQAHGSCLPLLTTAELPSYRHSFPTAHAGSSASQLGRDTARLCCVANCSLCCKLFNKIQYTLCPASALYSPCLPLSDLLTAGTISPSCQRMLCSV